MENKGNLRLSRFLTGGLRLFFHLLYNQFAWTYDWVAGLVSVGRWNDWVRETLPYLRGSPILELGHGPGHLQVSLWKRGDQPIGLDASPYMGGIARRRLFKGSSGYQLVTGKAQAVPFQNGFFSCVVATFPSEYIFDPEALSEIWRVMIPGGRMVILPGGWITGRGVLDRAAAWLFRTTHQSPFVSQMEVLLLEGLRNSGYEVEVKFIKLESSRLLLVLAEKPP